MHSPNVYYAVVDENGDYRLDWTPASAPVVRYLYHHHDAKLLICHESPDDQNDCSIVATIAPQLTLEDIGLAPPQSGTAGSYLIATLDALFGPRLDRGDPRYGAAHAKRLAYLSLYLAAQKNLPARDTMLLLLAAYCHDFGHDHDDWRGGDGLRRFTRYLGGHKPLDPDLLQATFSAILTRVGQPWSRRDTSLLIHVVADARTTGWTRRLQGWAADLRQLDSLRFGRPAALAQLHDHDAMRLLYASRQELLLIPEPQPKEQTQ